MKAKIISAKGALNPWYKKHIGKVFDVSPYHHMGMNTGDWEAKDPDYDGVAIIAAEDCEILPRLCPHCGKEVPNED